MKYKSAPLVCRWRGKLTYQIALVWWSGEAGHKFEMDLIGISRVWWVKISIKIFKIAWYISAGLGCYKQLRMKICPIWIHRLDWEIWSFKKSKWIYIHDSWLALRLKFYPWINIISIANSCHLKHRSLLFNVHQKCSILHWHLIFVSPMKKILLISCVLIAVWIIIIHYKQHFPYAYN